MLRSARPLTGTNVRALFVACCHAAKALPIVVAIALGPAAEPLGLVIVTLVGSTRKVRLRRVQRPPGMPKAIGARPPALGWSGTPHGRLAKAESRALMSTSAPTRVGSISPLNSVPTARIASWKDGDTSMAPLFDAMSAAPRKPKSTRLCCSRCTAFWSGTVALLLP